VTGHTASAGRITTGAAPPRDDHLSGRGRYGGAARCATSPPPG